jgi:hypothetical protein
VARALLPLIALAVAVALGGQVAASPQPWSSGPTTQVVVQLASPPLALANDANVGRRVDAEQRRFASALRSSLPAASIRWRYRIVANGVSVVLARSELPRLRSLPGVTRVYGATTYRALAGPDAATIRARELPGSTLANAGAGLKIGIIDDGVDQSHAFFDPSGYTMPAGYPKGQAAYTTA